MRTILVVDDDQTFAETIRASMDKNEYAVVAASNGLQGLEMVKKVSPDAILLDMRMPEMGGIEFLHQMKEVSGQTKIPIIITSNDSSLETISEGVELGVRGYILKSNESLGMIVKNVKDLFAK